MSECFYCNNYDTDSYTCKKELPKLRISRAEIRYVSLYTACSGYKLRE